MRRQKSLSAAALAILLGVNLLGAGAAVAQSSTVQSNPSAGCAAGSSASCTQQSDPTPVDDRSGTLKPNTGTETTEPDNSSGGGEDSAPLPSGGNNGDAVVPLTGTSSGASGN